MQLTLMDLMGELPKTDEPVEFWDKHKGKWKPAVVFRNYGDHMCVWTLDSSAAYSHCDISNLGSLWRRVR